MEAFKDVRHRVGITEVAISRLQEQALTVREDVDDIETRLRGLEKLAYKVLGAAAFGGALVALVFKVADYLNK